MVMESVSCLKFILEFLFYSLIELFLYQIYKGTTIPLNNTYFYSNTVVAESALDRLSCGLGGKTMMPHVEQNIPAMLSNPDWTYRYGTQKKDIFCITFPRSCLLPHNTFLLLVLQVSYCLEIISLQGQLNLRVLSAFMLGADLCSFSSYSSVVLLKNLWINFH